MPSLAHKHTSSRPTQANGFGLYFHVPFCKHKCSYCDFYSYTDYTDGFFGTWLESIELELKEGLSWLGTVPAVESLFVGGGTPSLLPMSVWEGFFDAVQSVVSLAQAEITIEANPETLTPELCRAWKAQLPINRISLGAQSFSQKRLDQLERLASPSSIGTAVQILKEAGFDNFSLDLIFALPDQTVEEVLEDLDAAVALGPNHISFYNLTLKPGHKLYHLLPDEDRAADLYEAGVEFLAKAGYKRYEISNFSKPGFESRHNLLYWSGGSFLGFGPSAASRIFRQGRYWHRKQPALMNRKITSPPQFEETSHFQTVLEASFLELRKEDGVDASAFLDRYGYDLRESQRFVEFREQGLLKCEAEKLWLTHRGLMLCDWVSRELVDSSRF